MSACVKHPMAPADHVCGTCGHDFCTECVVFPFGLRKPAMCITCALDVGGVRRRATDRPRLHPRDVRRRVRARPERAAAAAASAAPAPVDEPGDLDVADDPGPEFGLDRPEDLPGGWRVTFD